MSFEGSEWYDSDVESVFARFCDPDVVTDRFASAGDTEIEVRRCEADGDGFVIETRRVISVDLPGFASKFLEPTNTMTQVEHWGPPDEDGTRSGTFRITVAGAPVETTGTLELTPDGDGTVHSVVGEVRVKIPVVGKKIGSFLSGTAKDRVAGDMAFNKDLFG